MVNASAPAAVATNGTGVSVNPLYEQADRFAVAVQDSSNPLARKVHCDGAGKIGVNGSPTGARPTAYTDGPSSQQGLNGGPVETRGMADGDAFSSPLASGRSADGLPRASTLVGLAAPASRTVPAQGDHGARAIATEAFTPILATAGTTVPDAAARASPPSLHNGFLAPPAPASKRTSSPKRSHTMSNPSTSAPTAGPSIAATSSARSPGRGLGRPTRTLSQGAIADSAAATVTAATGDGEAAFRDSLARQADEIRRERAERRRTAAEQERAPTPRIVAKGNPIGDGHSSWLLMFNMLTGIRVAVSRCEAKVKRPLTRADYKATTKFSFDTLGNELTPSVGHDFKFKDYAPWVFRDLREHFCVDPADYLVSLTAKYILSELGSPGKSGSFFYYSSDFRYIIKTVSRSEHRFLRSILPAYHAHVQANPHTLISRFYGLHRVKMPRGRKVAFLVTANLFPPHLDMHETYDLKGSSQGREYPEDKAVDHPGHVLKDMNWVHRHRCFELGPEKKAFFEEQLRRDVEMLSRERIMDYSLLVGIHDLGRGNKDNLREQALSIYKPETSKLRRRPTQIQREADANAFRQALERSDPQALSTTSNHLPDKDRSEKRHFLFYQDEGGMRATGAQNQPLEQILYVGIIDILTPYTLYKRVEHWAKAFKYDGETISAVPPDQYGARFLRFMQSSIRGADLSLRPKVRQSAQS